MSTGIFLFYFRCNANNKWKKLKIHRILPFQHKASKVVVVKMSVELCGQVLILTANNLLIETQFIYCHEFNESTFLFAHRTRLTGDLRGCGQQFRHQRPMLPCGSVNVTGGFRVLARSVVLHTEAQCSRCGCLIFCFICGVFSMFLNV